MRYLALLLATATAPLLAATWQPPITVTLKPQHGSHERGTAVITRHRGELIVDVRMTGMMKDTPAQLVHLHRGSCDRLALHDAVDLDPLVAGRSRTVLRGARALRRLGTGTYYVSVHKLLANVSMHVACGGPLRLS